MKRTRAIVLLLLSDERSAVRQRPAVLLSVGVLGVLVAGLILIALGEQTYRDFDRRVLFALHGPADYPLA